MNCSMSMFAGPEQEFVANCLTRKGVAIRRNWAEGAPVYKEIKHGGLHIKKLGKVRWTRVGACCCVLFDGFVYMCDRAEQESVANCSTRLLYKLAEPEWGFAAMSMCHLMRLFKCLLDLSRSAEMCRRQARAREWRLRVARC